MKSIKFASAIALAAGVLVMGSAQAADGGTIRIHGQVEQGHGCDINEFNGGAYVIAKQQGRDFTSLPVFLHRRFRHGFIYVNKTKVREPSDLIGKRIGVQSATIKDEVEHAERAVCTSVKVVLRTNGVHAVAQTGGEMVRVCLGRAVGTQLESGGAGDGAAPFVWTQTDVMPPKVGISVQ